MTTKKIPAKYRQPLNWMVAVLVVAMRRKRLVWPLKIRILAFRSLNWVIRKAAPNSSRLAHLSQRTPIRKTAMVQHQQNDYLPSRTNNNDRNIIYKQNDALKHLMWFHSVIFFLFGTHARKNYGWIEHFLFFYLKFHFFKRFLTKKDKDTKMTEKKFLI